MRESWRRNDRLGITGIAARNLGGGWVTFGNRVEFHDPQLGVHQRRSPRHDDVVREATRLVEFRAVGPTRAEHSTSWKLVATTWSRLPACKECEAA